MTEKSSLLPDILRYYATQGIVTDPGEYRTLFDNLPDDIPQLVKIVQGLILHYGWADNYGVKPSEERSDEKNLRKVSRQLRRIMEIDDSPLAEERPPESRLLGCCRDFSTFLTAILRHKGVPARARCGFATYFAPKHYEDHWVCQYWKAEDRRWVTIDAQLDQLQRDILDIKFDIADMQEGLFLPAGKAWQMCRTGKVDPETFGFHTWHGMGFIRGNLVRDLLSLNKIELLAWDLWTLVPEYAPPDIPLEQMELLDYLASVTMGGDKTFPEVRSIYENEKRLRPPAGWEP